MSRPDFEAAKAHAVHRLKHELSPILFYHSLEHTLQDVIPACKRLAVMEGIDGHEQILLLTAGYYHDIGFIEQDDGHEDIGTRIVGEVLPRFNYSSDQIALIQSMIMATKLPRVPETLLEKILMDADLDVLGREDFLKRSLDLRSERAALGLPSSEAEWFGIQLAFLQNHHYWTASAQLLRNERKRKNIQLLEGLLVQAQN